MPFVAHKYNTNAEWNWYSKEVRVSSNSATRVWIRKKEWLRTDTWYNVAMQHMWCTCARSLQLSFEFKRAEEYERQIGHQHCFYLYLLFANFIVSIFPNRFFSRKISNIYLLTKKCQIQLDLTCFFRTGCTHAYLLYRCNCKVVVVVVLSSSVSLDSCCWRRFIQK